MSTDGQKPIVYIDEDIADLVPGFMDIRRNDIKEMNTALTAGDFESIRSVGHKMKGAGGGYGFDAITDFGMRLEEAAKVSHTAEIRSAIDGLATYVDTVEIIYEE